MRASLGTALGGLLLAATALPVQAGEPIPLTDGDLDQVTAGANLIGLILGGSGSSNGALGSFSHIVGEVNGGGNQNFLLATGYAVSVNVAFGKGATASSNTGGTGFGDVAYTVTTPVSGGNNWFRFSASATGGAAAGVP